MVVVIFESWPAHGQMQRYLDMGASLQAHLASFEGFISIERFRSVADPNKLVALSFWRDEASVDKWRNATVHRVVQANSRSEVFDDYRLRVAAVLRDYGKFDRTEVPADSRTLF